MLSNFICTWEGYCVKQCAFSFVCVYTQYNVIHWTDKSQLPTKLFLGLSHTKGMAVEPQCATFLWMSKNATFTMYIDIDECELYDYCDYGEETGRVCVNTVGSYECTCPPGYFFCNTLYQCVCKLRKIHTCTVCVIFVASYSANISISSCIHVCPGHQDYQNSNLDFSILIF